MKYAKFFSLLYLYYMVISLVLSNAGTIVTVKVNLKM